MECEAEDEEDNNDDEEKLNDDEQIAIGVEGQTKMTLETEENSINLSGIEMYYFQYVMTQLHM